MANKYLNPRSVNETTGGSRSRRQALAAMIGAGIWSPGLLAAAEKLAPVRLTISESLVTDISINDAKAAMAIWLKRMMLDLNIVIEFNANVFDTTEEIVRRAHTGQFDVVALNVEEYRQIADTLDPTEIVSEAGAQSLEQYLLLVRRNKGIQQLGDLRGRRLLVLKGPKMCVASAWLSTILDEGRLGLSEQFFNTVTTEPKASRVILPVFFGQSEACLTSKRAFDMMCELNPQVGKELTSIATSPAMTLCFYVFRKNFHGLSRERFATVYTTLHNSPSGRQIAMLFQFNGMAVRNVSCLASALSILDAADRARARRGAGMRKG